jgi:hypothetical protein
MADKKQELVKYKEVEGFRDWRDYFRFSGEKYSDVSVAFLQDNFDMVKKTMRELIDNSYPYHSNTFRMPIKATDKDYIKGENDDLYFKFLEYAEYYEILVDAYYKGLEKEKSPTVTPDDLDAISETKDLFIRESRRLRRLILVDLSVSGIIPQATEKKIQPTAVNMEGVGL